MTEPFYRSKENSSGEVSKVDVFDDVAPNESASQLGSRSLSLLEHLTHLFKKTQRTVITVSYKSTYGKNSETFDITTCTSWAHFLQMVDKSPKLKIPIHAREIYHYLSDGGHSYVSALSALQEGKEYFVETDLDKPGSDLKYTMEQIKWSVEMEQFFERLKTEEGKTDEQVKKVRCVFAEQDIEFKQLMATGDLAITDAELEKYGITQGGLRKAILAVIKGNK